MGDDKAKFTGASSLYAGIFSKDKTALAPSSVTDASSSGAQAVVTDVAKTGEVVAAAEATPSAPSTASTDQTSKPAWSAALRFAPRKTTQQKKLAARPSTGLSATFASLPVQDASPITRTGSGSRTIAKAPMTVRSSSEQSTPSTSQLPPLAAPSHAPELFTTRSKIVAPSDRTFSPPPLTLPPEQIASDKELARAAAEARGEGEVKNTDHWKGAREDDEEEEDVNGFSKTKMGQRAKRKRNRRKRSPMRGASQTVNMDADYNPRVPNDYAAYTTLVAERRTAIRKRQREENEEWEEGSEEDSEDDRLDEERKRKLSRFAPPPNLYGGNQQSVPPAFSETLEDLDALVPDESPPPEAPSAHYAPAPPPPPTEPPLPPPQTGEEAYARRLAMSAQLAAQPQALPQAANAPPTPGPPPAASPPPVISPPDTSAAAAAAAAIAARLSAAAPPKEAAAKKFSAPTFVAAGGSFLPSSGNDEDASDGGGGMMNRAKKMMEGWGYKEGEGLGSAGNKGIVNPLTASKASPSGQTGARQHQQGKAWGAPSTPSPARGSIVNDNKDERELEERRRFGAPSQVVLLEDMVLATEVDDELRDEIGSECSKHGILAGVHIETHTPAGPRIFVKFTGMVGAWRTVRELDGRFFAGRTVRARYYPDAWWEESKWMGFL